MACFNSLIGETTLSTDKPTPPGGPEAQPGKPNPVPRFNTTTLLIAMVLVFGLALYWMNTQALPPQEITYSQFREQLAQGNIKQVEFTDRSVVGEFNERPTITQTETQDGKEVEKTETLQKRFYAEMSPYAGEELDKELREKGVVVKSRPPTNGAALLIIAYLIGTVLIFGFVWIMYRRARDQFMGGGILGGFSKSPAKRYETNNKADTFAAGAGLEGVKHDLEEIVEFLKNPDKFQRLGGRVPKGILLMGPPGTGKTLLARAVAGEAGVPFFSISGSEFIQMFVGVGASRVRDMFKTAKESSPCILFIDEIDAVGRVRGAGLGGGHDEREQTLNQILSEMDGFSQNEAVIVLAATNRPDVLDPALLRPGRFDRHITVDRPNHKGRLAIFKVHVRDVPLADNVDLDRLASGTVGLTGADIRNLVNEAALWATRKGKDKVDMDDFEHARDRVLMGPKREEVLSGKEKRMTAIHEAGHALLAWIVPGADRVHKVTIIPRGRSLGVTQLLPEEDRLNIGESELHGRLCFMLGGRAAEKLEFDEFSAGAENDLSQATRLARRMVTAWGMSDRLGPVAYRSGEEHPFLGKEIHEHREFSEHSAQLIDEEVAKILHTAYDKAIELLTKHREELEKLAAALEEQEVLDEHEIEELIGPSINKRSDTNGRMVDVAPSAEGQDIQPAPSSKP
ncbi:MAG: ATP-dependent metallopeptidase FtsH/Yme1/Tma family protein [Planctomycetota bacterium]|nr:MAG: ATP-dependent metallopeptidase FtsH/Yme1/Tma family protein [Planctomycetota bacterium]